MTRKRHERLVIADVALTGQCPDEMRANCLVTRRGGNRDLSALHRFAGAVLKGGPDWTP
jgi:hypothetical protein